MTLDEVVERPLDRVEGVVILLHTLVGRLVPQHTPRQHGHRAGHREVELDVVTRCEKNAAF